MDRMAILARYAVKRMARMIKLRLRVTGLMAFETALANLLSQYL